MNGTIYRSQASLIVAAMIVAALVAGSAVPSALGVPSSVQPSQADYFLDLVSSVVASDSVATGDTRGIAAGGGGGVGHAIDDKPSVRLRLLSLDRLSYETGDQVIYEVEIENVGTRPTVLPSSPWRVPAEAHEPSPRLYKGSLFLEVRDRAGLQRLAWLEPLPLFGSERVANTLQTLAPGQRALIRAPGYWRATEPETIRMLREPNGVVQVSAVLHLLEFQFLARSSNGIEVSVQDRLRR